MSAECIRSEPLTVFAGSVSIVCTSREDSTSKTTVVIECAPMKLK